MVNDMSIAYGIIIVFILIGISLPFINTAFGHPSTSTNIEIVNSETGEALATESSLSIFSIFFSVSKMFFWTFGDLPFWLDAIFISVRLLLGLIIARNVWIGGGA